MESRLNLIFGLHSNAKHAFRYETGPVAKYATGPVFFAIAAKAPRGYLGFNDKRLSKRTLAGRLSPPLSLAPG
jgi:hypothetical protein